MKPNCDTNMIEHGRSLSDGQTGQGSVNSVTRIGDSVVRPAGEWTPAIHGLLNHLDKAGFRYSPKALRVDHERGIEVLSYIDGETAMRPWPPCLLMDEGIRAIALMLREYHDAVANYVPENGALWRVPDVYWKDGMIVRHSDLGPWNMIWKSSELVGLIDWDLAEPGYPIEDVAQVAWNCVPLTTPARCAAAGIDPAQQQKRLSILCDTYGVDQALVLQTLIEFQRNEMDRTTRLGQAGVEPWQTFWQRGDVTNINVSMNWLMETYEYLFNI